MPILRIDFENRATSALVQHTLDVKRSIHLNVYYAKCFLGGLDKAAVAGKASGDLGVGGREGANHGPAAIKKACC